MERATHGAAALQPRTNRYKGPEARLKAPDKGRGVGKLRRLLEQRDPAYRPSASEFQAAVRKEFPGNVKFQGVFDAQRPLPASARDVLALGRHVAREAPGYAANLIKYAINAATVSHLVALCDQLEGELGGVDPVQRARTIEEQIVAAAQRAFAGRPELAAFEPKSSP